MGSVLFPIRKKNSVSQFPLISQDWAKTLKLLAKCSFQRILEKVQIFYLIRHVNELAYVSMVSFARRKFWSWTLNCWNTEDYEKLRKIFFMSNAKKKNQKTKKLLDIIQYSNFVTDGRTNLPHLNTSAFIYRQKLRKLNVVFQETMLTFT